MNKGISESELAARKALLGDEDDSSNVEKFINDKNGLEDEEMEKSPKEEKKEQEYVSLTAFVPISPEKLPSKHLFYDDDVDITIRPASIQEIKVYSSIDDTDAFEVERAVATMLNNCCKIVKSGNTLKSYRDLSEFDKVYTFFSIRDRTFLAHKRESNLMNKSECSHCGHKNSKTIDQNTFGFYQISEELMRYYNENERCFIFEDSEIGNTPLKFYIPTVGSSEKIMEYIKKKEIEKQTGEGGYYNTNDLTILMYITQDWRSFDDEDKYIMKNLSDMKNIWNESRYELATEVTRMLKVGIKPNIIYACESCGKEIKAAIRFQRWGHLFSSKHILSKFFKDTESDTAS